MKCTEAVQCHSKLSTDNASSETLGCPCISPYTTVTSNKNIFISCIHTHSVLEIASMTWRSGSQHTAGFDSVGWGNLCMRANFYSSK